MENKARTILKIKNFKSLKDIEIELKPLTFFFGPNSSGKSSFFKALKFLRENLYPLATDKLKYKVDDKTGLGSFKEIIRNGDVAQKLVFEIEVINEKWDKHKKERNWEYYNSCIDYSIGNHNYASFEKNLMPDINHGVRSSFTDNQNFNIEDVESKNFEVKINQDSLIDDEDFVDFFSGEYSIKSTGFSVSSLDEVLSDFPFKLRIEFSLIESEPRIELINIKNSFDGTYFEYYPALQDETKVNYSWKIFNNSKYENYFNLFMEKQYHIPFIKNDFEDFHGIIKRYFYFIIQKKKFWSNLDYKDKKYLFESVLRWYHTIFQYIPSRIENLLNFEHLPTVRELPRNFYELKDSDFNKEDYYGIPHTVSHKNQNSKTFLTKYLKLFSLSDGVSVKKGKQVGSLEFKHLNSNTKSNLSEASSGFIQLLPIIFKWYDAFHGELGISEFNLLIEQPELHLHPKLQSELGEMFCELINNVVNLHNYAAIETHSEHLIRKIQVEIAKNKISQNLVAVYYFDNSDGFTEIIPMLIENNGFFKEPWPKGFFDDSYNLTKELILANKN